MAGSGGRLQWIDGVAWVGVAAAAAVTLLPAGPSGLSGLEGIAAAERLERAAGLSLADALRNVLLFGPLGVALRRLALVRTLIVALAASGAIELAQAALPGRFPSAGDVLANVAGAALGHGAVRVAGEWIPARGARASLLAWLAAAVACAVLVGGSLLGRPATTSSRIWVHRVMDLGHLAPFDGIVHYAAVDDLALPQGPLAASDAAHAKLAGDFRLSLITEPGPPAEGLAGILMLNDRERRELWLVARTGDDLALRFRATGSALRLESPRLRVSDGFAGIASDERIGIRIERRGGELCAAVHDRRVCGLGVTPGDGWVLVAPKPLWLASGRALAGSIWVALWLAPVGWWSARARRPTPALAAAAALLAGPWLAGGAGLTVAQAATAVAVLTGTGVLGARFGAPLREPTA